jgi:hypothetical protein
MVCAPASSGRCSSFVAGWSTAHFLEWQQPADVLASGMLMRLTVFAALTLHLQRHSKRARFDATQRYWRLAMLCTLAASTLWLISLLLPEAAAGRQAAAVGRSLLFGSFMSVMHRHALQDRSLSGLAAPAEPAGGGRILAPNMQQGDRRSGRSTTSCTPTSLRSPCCWRQRCSRTGSPIRRQWRCCRQWLAAAQPAGGDAFYRQHRQRIASLARATPVPRPG